MSTECSREDVEYPLKISDYDAKVVIISILQNFNKDVATKNLSESNGFVRNSLQNTK